MNVVDLHLSQGGLHFGSSMNHFKNDLISAIQLRS